MKSNGIIKNKENKTKCQFLKAWVKTPTQIPTWKFRVEKSEEWVRYELMKNYSFSWTTQSVSQINEYSEVLKFKCFSNSVKFGKSAPTHPINPDLAFEIPLENFLLVLWTFLPKIQTELKSEAKWQTKQKIRRFLQS